MRFFSGWMWELNQWASIVLGSISLGMLLWYVLQKQVGSPAVSLNVCGRVFLVSRRTRNKLFSMTQNRPWLLHECDPTYFQFILNYVNRIAWQVSETDFPTLPRDRSARLQIAQDAFHIGLEAFAKHCLDHTFHERTLTREDVANTLLLKPKQAWFCCDMVLNQPQLSGAVFESCDFSGTTFRGGQLDDCVFKNCNLSRCIFTDNASLTDAVFEACTLTQASFQGVSRLCRVSFQNSNLSRVDFPETCELELCEFLYCGLQEVVFHQSNLTRVLMECCSGGKFKHVTWEFFASRKLEEDRFRPRLRSPIVLFWNDVKDFTFVNCNFTGRELGFRGRSFNGCQFEGCHFRVLEMVDVSFNKCSFLQCEFGQPQGESEQMMLSVRFLGCRFVQSILGQWTIAQLDARLCMCSFKNTKTDGETNAVFRGTCTNHQGKELRGDAQVVWDKASVMLLEE